MIRSTSVIYTGQMLALKTLVQIEEVGIEIPWILETSTSISAPLLTALKVD